MTKLQKRFHRISYFTFLVCVSLLIVMHTTACGAATWLTDASTVIEAVLASITSLSGVIAILVPAAGPITAALNLALQEVQKIAALVAQYQTTPGESLLAEIESAIQLAITNLQGLLSPIGVPAAAAQKIAAIAEAILTQFEAWAALIPALKVSTPVATGAAAQTTISAAHVAKLAAVHSLPLKSEDFKTKINAILSMPTGDATVDAAFAKVQPL
jgi:hypothetical protein